MNTPPPLSPAPKDQPSGMNRGLKGLIVVAGVPGVLIALLLLLRLIGFLRPFYIPTGSMSPTIIRGDHVIMEKLTFLERKPRRGDVIVFKTDDIETLPPRTYFVQRIAGEPGEHVQFFDDQLHINGAITVLSNLDGAISFPRTRWSDSDGFKSDITVPADQYFTIGDLTTNSLDSRFWGCLPRKNIVGRIWFCYWPPERIGIVE